MLRNDVIGGNVSHFHFSKTIKLMSFLKKNTHTHVMTGDFAFVTLNFSTATRNNRIYKIIIHVVVYY